MKRVRAKIGVNNKLKGSYGETTIQKGKPTRISINVKKHKGDKRQLADTIKHELMHAKHPKMHEKTVYKKMEPEMSKAEQDKMLAKLRNKKMNYKQGAVKRKLKIKKGEKVKTGELITRAKAMSRPENVAFMGMV